MARRPKPLSGEWRASTPYGLMPLGEYIARRMFGDLKDSPDPEPYLKTDEDRAAAHEYWKYNGGDSNLTVIDGGKE